MLSGSRDSEVGLSHTNTLAFFSCSAYQVPWMLLCAQLTICTWQELPFIDGNDLHVPGCVFYLLQTHNRYGLHLKLVVSHDGSGLLTVSRVSLHSSKLVVWLTGIAWGREMRQLVAAGKRAVAWASCVFDISEPLLPYKTIADSWTWPSAAASHAL